MGSNRVYIFFIPINLIKLFGYGPNIETKQKKPVYKPKYFETEIKK